MKDKASILEYIKPTDRIYEVALKKDELDWKGFLHKLINQEGLNPWDIDLSLFTAKYLKALKEIEKVDFNVSGKFLTIAVFLLKVKAENLIDIEIRGLDNKIDSLKMESLDGDLDFDALEELDEIIEKKKTYTLKYRNPLARKRKVTIFDLIKTLERTFKESNKRKVNFFLKNSKVEYKGPTYEKKKKDLKVIIEELHNLIVTGISNKSGHLCFHHLFENKNYKEEVLEKFIPLLHLHNQTRIEISQKVHLGEIKIDKLELNE